VPIVLAANSDLSNKMKSIKKNVQTIRFRPLPPRLLQFYLNKILQSEDAKISPDSLMKLIKESGGDIRSMINFAQALVTGFNPPTEKSFEILDVEEGVNAFYKSNSVDEARSILYSLRIDPREKINAFYSSVITSNISADDMQKFLQIISTADMLYGKIMKTQQWRLLRYLDAILLGLYKKNLPIRYSKYNLSWPILNRIRWDGAKIKSLVGLLAKDMHVSKSTFSSIYFRFLLLCIKNKKIDLELDESLEEIVQKEIDLIK
jgi:replication factor C large subunit